MLTAEKPRQNLRRPVFQNVSSSRLNSRNMTPRVDHIEHIWIITGPAGSGKSTVAQFLAKEMQVPYVEGDDWHSQLNKDKMAKGIPLTDADRWDWLITLREQAVLRLQNSNSVIVTCSALKHKYRDVIRIANYEHPSVQIHFIYLKLDEATLQRRVAERAGHYMKEAMVHSQIAALEEPDEEWDVLPVDVRNDPITVQKEALAAIKKKLAEYELPEAEK